MAYGFSENVVFSLFLPCVASVFCAYAKCNLFINSINNSSISQSSVKKSNDKKHFKTSSGISSELLETYFMMNEIRELLKLTLFTNSSVSSHRNVESLRQASGTNNMNKININQSSSSFIASKKLNFINWTEEDFLDVTLDLPSYIYNTDTKEVTKSVSVEKQDQTEPTNKNCHLNIVEIKLWKKCRNRLIKKVSLKNQSSSSSWRPLSPVYYNSNPSVVSPSFSTTSEKKIIPLANQSKPQSLNNNNNEEMKTEGRGWSSHNKDNDSNVKEALFTTNIFDELVIQVMEHCCDDILSKNL